MGGGFIMLEAPICIVFHGLLHLGQGFGDDLLVLLGVDSTLVEVEFLFYL